MGEFPNKSDNKKSLWSDQGNCVIRTTFFVGNILIKQPIISYLVVSANTNPEPWLAGRQVITEICKTEIWTLVPAELELPTNLIVWCDCLTVRPSSPVTTNTDWYQLREGGWRVGRKCESRVSRKCLVLMDTPAYLVSLIFSSIYFLLRPVSASPILTYHH